MSPEDAYLIFGLPMGADWADIQRRHKDEAVAWHPDRFLAGSPQYFRAQERLKQLNAARDCLRNYLRNIEERETEASGKGARQSGRSPNDQFVRFFKWHGVLGAICGGLIASGMGWALEMNPQIALVIGLFAGGLAGGMSADSRHTSGPNDSH